MSQPVERRSPDPLWWHVPLLLAVSGSWEWLFLRHGLNRIDEGWVLYTAMQLGRGAELYRDVFFVFPPGHALPAWLGYAWDAPGVVATRALYAALDVALCLSLYALGRRLMAPGWALLGALLLAVAAPDSHLWHLLFGYRYLVLSVLALLCFARRQAGADLRWSVAAGACTGLALCFRLTPALSVGAALALASIAADPRPRSWLREALALAGGAALLAGPIYGWLAADVGVEALWREIVVRPVAMTAAQSLPLPELAWPSDASRGALTRAFLAFEFRAVALLYAVYGVVLARSWLRARRDAEAFPHALLLATVLWGGIYYLRSLGRSDAAHLDSAIPPVCLLLAHALSRGLARWTARTRAPSSRQRAVAFAVATSVLAAWGLAQGVDVYARPERRGLAPFETLDGEVANRSKGWAETLDARVRAIRAWTKPDDTLLDLTGSPLFYVLSDRMGPGGFDVLMPGTFLSEDEERGFVERLEAAPPALVIWPHRPFDDLPSRAIGVTAPRLTEWVVRRYRPARSDMRRFPLLIRTDAPEPPPIP